MILEIGRILVAGFFVLFVPGFVWSFVFFPKKELDSIERVALGFGLSIAMVPLTVFALDRILGVRINTPNVFFTILGLIVTGIVLGHFLGKFDVVKILKRLKKFK